MRSFVSAPTSSSCGPQTSATRTGDQPVNPLTNFLRAITSDTVQTKQIGSDVYAASHSSVLFSDDLFGATSKQHQPSQRTHKILVDRIRPTETNRGDVVRPILFDSTTNFRIDGKNNFPPLDQSNEWVHAFTTARVPEINAESLGRDSAEKQVASYPFQAAQESHIPPWNVITPHIPWENYRQRNQPIKSEAHQLPPATQNVKKPEPSLTSNKLSTSEVELSHEQFLSQLKSDPIEYEPIQSLDQQTIITPTSKEPILDRVKAKELAEKLRGVENEGLSRSEFLRFVDSLANGSLEIKENQVIDSATGNEIDWTSVDHGPSSMIKHLEDTWNEAEEMGYISSADISKFRAALYNSPLLDASLDDATDITANRSTNAFQPEMLPNYTSDGFSVGCQSYQFQSDNPYLKEMQEETAQPLHSLKICSVLPNVDLMGLAVQLIREGKNMEAVKVLEAEVQRNKESSEGWRLLGQLHADNEQDVEAIICSKKGHEVDPFNLSSLLTLGISLANEMDATQALGHLKVWLSHHEMFEHLVPSNESSETSTSPLYSEDLRRQITELFHQAVTIDPQNADLHIGLGVIHNISRQFNRALDHFIEALQLSPLEETSSIWNKIGATLANSGCSEAALLAYHQALALRPNYPRAWANLGIAHANLDLLNDAIRFYLSALSLNPKAVHLWHHIRTAVLHMGRYELLEPIDNRNIEPLRNEFKVVISPKNLPTRQTLSIAMKDQIIEQIKETCPVGWTWLKTHHGDPHTFEFDIVGIENHQNFSFMSSWRFNTVGLFQSNRLELFFLQSSEHSFLRYSKTLFTMSGRPNLCKETFIRLYKNQEPSLDELSVQLALASSSLKCLPITTLIEGPDKSPSKQTDKMEALPKILVSNGTAAPSVSFFAADRLAALTYLSNIYRTSNAFSPTQIQKLANWVSVASPDDLRSMIETSPNGKYFLAQLLHQILPEINSIPTSIPSLPSLSTSGLICSLISSTTAQLSLIGLGLTIETARLPLNIINPAIASLNAEVHRAANLLQWLLDESKLTRCNDVTDNTMSLLTQSIFTVASFLEASESCAKNCRTEVKQSFKLLNNDVLLGILPVPRIALIFSSLANFKDTINRCSNVLLPFLASRMESNKLRTILQWPEDQPHPLELVIPIHSRPVNESSVEELSNELKSLGEIEANVDWNNDSNVQYINRKLIQLTELIVKAVVLEISMSLLLLADDEVELYNAAVQKAYKKKKNVTSKLHYGRALQKFVSELLTELRSDELSEKHLSTPELSNYKLLLLRCECGGILSIASLLSNILTPLNQGSRRPKVAKGALDTDPRRMVVREHVFELIRDTFGRYGAVAIDTPVFELRETLMGKYGEDQKLIFDLKDQGGEQLSLRYDLTVPFARYCATQNVERIRRYHIGKVYRRDEPQMARGRFREFYQCDFDIAGDFDPMVADAEVLSVLVDILRAVKGAVGTFEVKLNHRRLLDAVMALCGVPSNSFRAICSAIDKLDKLSWDHVKIEMCETKGLLPEIADRIHRFVAMKGKPFELLAELEKIDELREIPGAMKCLIELRTLFNYLEAYGVLADIVFDMALARGLDYYTGVIFEAILTGQELVGSVGAGGRYDKLVGMFSGKDIPAVGVSIGVERLFRVIEMNLGLSDTALCSEDGSKKKLAQDKAKLNNVQQLKDHQIDVFVCSIGDQLLCERIKICKMLRDANIPTDFYYSNKVKLCKQLTSANEQGVQLAVIFGEDELQRGTVKLRTFKYGVDNDKNHKDEIEVKLDSLVQQIQLILAESKSTKQQTFETILHSAPIKQS